MLYIYLVLGCWLQYVFADYAWVFTPWWQFLMVMAMVAYVSVAYLVAFDKVDLNRVSKSAEPKHVRIALVGLSALLAGFPFYGIGYVIATYMLSYTVLHKKSLAK